MISCRKSSTENTVDFTLTAKCILQERNLYIAFIHKKSEIEKQVHNYRKLLTQLEDDISAIEQGKSNMSYMEIFPRDYV